MKKAITAVLSTAVVLSLAACSPAANPNPSAYNTNGSDAYNARFINGESPNHNQYRANTTDSGRADTPPFQTRDFGYDNDGFYGYTNTNPRLYPNLNTRNLWDDAQRIANTAASVSGVNNARVVINGDTAYVGLDLDSNVSSNQAQNIENQVQHFVASDMPRYRIRVSSDADIFGRLRDIDNAMRNGRPVTDFNDALRDLGNRMNIGVNRTR